MQLTLYPHDIQKSTAQFGASLPPQVQSDLFDRFKRMALYLKSRNKGTVATVAVAIQQLANAHGCSVRCAKTSDSGRCDMVVIESKNREL